MTKLLELRERLRKFYGKYDIYIQPAIRFVVAIIVFLLINMRIGYMSRLKSPVVAIVLALLCTFLPVNTIAILSALLILAHLYALSLEACAIALLLFLLMFFMYYKLAPKNGYTTVLSAVLCYFKVPEVMPTVVGLGKKPYSALSMLCGIIVYYFLRGIRENQSLLGIVEEESEVSKFTLVLQQIIGNKELYVMAAALVITALLVYVIQRQAIRNAWKVAIGVGNAVNLIVLLIGSFLIGNAGEILWIILGSIFAVLIGLVMEFFLFHLDYSRTERVQFEDDEYYYYVKAVPKIFVSTTDKKVKQINRRRQSGITKRELADEFEIDRELLDD